MRYTLFVLAITAMVALTGCSKKSSNNPITTLPPDGQANVTFTMGMESGTDGMIFIAIPNADVKLTKVDISYPAQQFSTTVTNPNPNQVFPKNARVQLGEYTGIETHQQWVLVFHGTVASTGQTFTVTVHWDVV